MTQRLRAQAPGTQEAVSRGLRLALYEPDIAPNVGAVIRLGACMAVPVDVIEPCGFAFSLHAVRRQVGFLPEEPPLYREMTVEGFRTFVGEMRGLSRASTVRRLHVVVVLTHTVE